MAKYGLLLVVIALMVVGGASILGLGLNSLFGKSGNYVNGIAVPAAS